MRKTNHADDKWVGTMYKLLHGYFFAVLLRWTFWLIGVWMLQSNPDFLALVQTLPLSNLFLFLEEHPLLNQLSFWILHLALGVPGLLLLLVYFLYPILVGKWLKKVIDMFHDLYFNLRVQPHCQSISRDFIRVIDLASETEDIQDVGTTKQLQIHLNGKPFVCRVDIKKTRYCDTAVLIGEKDTIIASLRPGEARTFLTSNPSIRLLMIYCPVRVYTQRPERADHID